MKLEKMERKDSANVRGNIWQIVDIVKNMIIYIAV